MIVPTLLCDYYKTIHKDYYPDGLTKVWAYFTPRQSRLPHIKGVVPFGVQGMIKEYLIDIFKSTLKGVYYGHCDIDIRAACRVKTDS